MSTFDLLLTRRAQRVAGREEEEDDDEEVPSGFSIRDKFVNQEGFRIMCAKAFEEVDFNENGKIDLTEFYAGMLLLYDKINSIPWGGRKKPPKRKAVKALFNAYLSRQKDEHEELVYESFELIVQNHFDQLVESILWRILTITILFPVLSVYLSQAVFSIPGVEEGLGRFSSAVPTLIVSSLVTFLPFIEKGIASLLTAEQKLSIGIVRQMLEDLVRGVVQEVEKDITAAMDTFQRWRERKIKLRHVPKQFMASRRRWVKAEEKRNSLPRA